LFWEPQDPKAIRSSTCGEISSAETPAGSSHPKTLIPNHPEIRQKSVITLKEK
jgi:hypothetical protein